MSLHDRFDRQKWLPLLLHTPAFVAALLTIALVDRVTTFARTAPLESATLRTLWYAALLYAVCRIIGIAGEVRSAIRHEAAGATTRPGAIASRAVAPPTASGVPRPQGSGAADSPRAHRP